MLSKFYVPGHQYWMLKSPVDIVTIYCIKRIFFIYYTYNRVKILMMHLNFIYDSLMTNHPISRNKCNIALLHSTIICNV